VRVSFAFDSIPGRDREAIEMLVFDTVLQQLRLDSRAA
jgi:hypothetical protein